MKKMKNLFLVGIIILLLLPFGFVGAEHEGLGVQNPIESKTITKFIDAILGIVVKIGTPIVGIFIIYSGFLFVSARGNPEKLSIAKTTFLWTIIGAAIVLGAVVISDIISGTIDQIKGGPGLGS